MKFHFKSKVFNYYPIGLDLNQNLLFFFEHIQLFQYDFFFYYTIYIKLKIIFFSVILLYITLKFLKYIPLHVLLQEQLYFLLQNPIIIYKKQVKRTLLLFNYLLLDYRLDFPINYLFPYTPTPIVVVFCQFIVILYLIRSLWKAFKYIYYLKVDSRYDKFLISGVFAMYVGFCVTFLLICSDINPVLLQELVDYATGNDESYFYPFYFIFTVSILAPIFFSW